MFGAVAYLRAEQGSDHQAQNQGLFVVRATGDSAAIVNPEGFKPREFGWIRHGYEEDKKIVHGHRNPQNPCV